MRYCIKKACLNMQVMVLLLPASLVFELLWPVLLQVCFCSCFFCPFACAVFWSGCRLYLFPFLFLLHAWVLQSLFLSQGWHSGSWNSTPVHSTSVGQNCQEIQKLKVYQYLFIGAQRYTFCWRSYLSWCCNWTTHTWYNRRLIY